MLLRGGRGYVLSMLPILTCPTLLLPARRFPSPPVSFLHFIFSSLLNFLCWDYLLFPSTTCLLYPFLSSFSSSHFYSILHSSCSLLSSIPCSYLPSPPFFTSYVFLYASILLLLDSPFLVFSYLVLSFFLSLPLPHIQFLSFFSLSLHFHLLITDLPLPSHDLIYPSRFHSSLFP